MGVGPPTVRWPEPNGTGNVVWSQQNQSSSPMRGTGTPRGGVTSHRGDDGWLINRRWLAEIKKCQVGKIQHFCAGIVLFFKDMYKNEQILFVAKFGCSFVALHVLTIYIDRLEGVGVLVLVFCKFR